MYKADVFLNFEKYCYFFRTHGIRLLILANSITLQPAKHPPFYWHISLTGLYLKLIKFVVYLWNCLVYRGIKISLHLPNITCNTVAGTFIENCIL